MPNLEPNHVGRSRRFTTRLATTAVALLVAVPGVAAAAPGSIDARRANDTIARAIDAPYTDARIEPIEIARAFWQARVDARPEDTLSRTRLATTLMAEARETGDLTLYVAAEGLLGEVLAVNPTDEAALLALGSVRAANHDFTASLQIVDEVLARNPSSKAARTAVADYNFELGNYEVAATQLDALAAELPDPTAIAGRRAKLAAIRGRNREAVRRAAEALLAAAHTDLRPSEAAFYRFQLAHFLYQGGAVRRALDVLDAGLRIDPSHLPSLELRARVLVSLGKLRAAAASYESLVASSPAADLHGELAKVYRALGDEHAAAEQEALGLELGYAALRDFPAERRHLAAFFAEFDPPTALVAAEADLVTRQDVGAYDALAWAQFVNGRYDEAAISIRDALATGTRNARVLYHAGMIERATGNARRAERLLSDALHIDPRFDVTQAPIARAALHSLARGRLNSDLAVDPRHSSSSAT